MTTVMNVDLLVAPLVAVTMTTYVPAIAWGPIEIDISVLALPPAGTLRVVEEKVRLTREDAGVEKAVRDTGPAKGPGLSTVMFETTENVPFWKCPAK